ncbi:hypothetical protein JX265_011027 [Neoarthrinium moseri]|uniref:Cyclin-dependent protein kinase regulator pho80 n=1 Tax=Neoarthrinium moseri TaxID=1658444 RepID=A0A9P9WDG3_9PEZI|nr:uncharacterized protein JN550_009609 [Neoarthrinium moseri]KAI1844133.1 hypothetical protein JX266_009617 [Neoarthrinium moseri]KAI1857997.1 hypothetical protein JX265_011027 [Neoarthrinium moseri]KAI1863289.1 hypothetical protein JN550_009609 [Neoarthrinium moseri]
MRLSALFAGLACASLAAAAEHTAAIYIQPVLSGAGAPALLAEVTYDPFLPGEAVVSSFEFPELPEDAQTVRVGVRQGGAWVSSTSIASARNFAKGYKPHLLLTTDEAGDVVSAGVRGVRIDAGQTRDFGPKAVVTTVARGEQVQLGKPVVLSPEGKKTAAGEPEEKTLLQKYWWVIGIVLLLTVTGGGGDGK